MSLPTQCNVFIRWLLIVRVASLLFILNSLTLIVFIVYSYGYTFNREKFTYTHSLDERLVFSSYSMYRLWGVVKKSLMYGGLNSRIISTSYRIFWFLIEQNLQLWIHKRKNKHLSCVFSKFHFDVAISTNDVLSEPLMTMQWSSIICKPNGCNYVEEFIPRALKFDISMSSMYRVSRK